MESLYLVAALLEDPGTEHTVWDLKYMAYEKSGSTKGLKVLPHITQIHPFKRSEEEEDKLIDQLNRTIGSFTPLELHFNGFGYFESPKSNTIYIKVEDDPVLQEQHKALNILARNNFGFEAKNAPLRYTPHMTIAYRDLDKQKFDKAWPSFCDRAFEEKMMLESLWLLKHNGFCWIPYQEFGFKGRKDTLF
jgi:2'-5' RNA ligase